MSKNTSKTSNNRKAKVSEILANNLDVVQPTEVSEALSTALGIDLPDVQTAKAVVAGKGKRAKTIMALGSENPINTFYLDSSTGFLSQCTARSFSKEKSIAPSPDVILRIKNVELSIGRTPDVRAKTSLLLANIKAGSDTRKKSATSKIFHANFRGEVLQERPANADDMTPIRFDFWGQTSELGEIRDPDVHRTCDYLECQPIQINGSWFWEVTVYNKVAK